MARTKASVGTKLSSGKSNKSRCGAPPPSTSTSTSSGSGDRGARAAGGGGGGGNPVCPRETPKWQRPITNFFCNNTSRTSSDGEAGDEASASTSKPKPKRNVIQSDDEDDDTSKEERPKNKVLDETIELEPLVGEDSHKIDEYYTKNDTNIKENGINDTDSEVNCKENGVSSGDETNGEEQEINVEENGISVGANIIKVKENVTNGKVDKGKGKGKGKKTNKENVNANIEERKSVKRDLEEVSSGEENEHVKKKKKVN